MPEALDQEIRHLQSLRDSEGDADGLAFASLADAFLRKGQTRDALALLTAGTARHPDYATGHVLTTRLYHGQGMFAEAEIAARRTLELDPRNLVALSTLAEMLQAQGKDEEASRLRWTLVDTDPESEEARAVADLPVIEPTVVPDAVSATTAPAATPPVTEGLIDLTSISLPEEPSSEPLSALAPMHDEDVAELSGDLNLDSLLTEPETEFAGIDAMSDGSDPVVGEADLLLGVEPQFADVESVARESTELSLDSEMNELVDVAGQVPVGEPEPDFVDLDALTLAPDEPVDVMDLGALAPDEPVDVMDLGALAPDEPVDVMDLGALAPDEPVDVMDLGALAPDEPVDVMDLGALAPDEPVDVMDLGALAPDLPLSDGEYDADPAPLEKKMISEDPIHTRTLAELYVKQGFTDQALAVYRSLLDSEPGAEDLLEKIAKLEGVEPPARTEEPSPAASSEEEVEELARELADAGSAADSDDVDTPFAWTPEEEGPEQERGDIGRYFDSLLDWKRED